MAGASAGWTKSGRFYIRSTDGQRLYEITVKRPDGVLRCQCVGYSYRKVCKHVKRAAAILHHAIPHSADQFIFWRDSYDDPNRQLLREPSSSTINLQSAVEAEKVSIR